MRLRRALLVLAALLSGPVAIGDTPAPWRLGFYWSPTAAAYPPSAVPWHLYTHVTQMGIRPTADCGIDERWYAVDAIKVDLVRTARAQGVPVLVTLIQDEPMTAIRACTAPDSINGFVARLAAWVKDNGYDGLDLDWEGNVDPARYQQLVNRLRLALPASILTTDITVDQRVYVVGVQDRLDRINLMNYDLSGNDYDGRPLRETWHHAPLRSAGDRQRFQSAEAAVDYLVESGIRPAKINLGVPFYGYVFEGCRADATRSQPCDRAVTSPGEAFGPGGLKRTQVEFNRIMALYGTGEQLWDEARETPYIRFGNPGAAGAAFVTYANERQMAAAVRFLAGRQLGGIMTFALHQEFMPAAAGDGRYPLSSAIDAAFRAAGAGGNAR